MLSKSNLLTEHAFIMRCVYYYYVLHTYIHVYTYYPFRENAQEDSRLNTPEPGALCRSRNFTGVCPSLERERGRTESTPQTAREWLQPSPPPHFLGQLIKREGTRCLDDSKAYVW